MKYYLLLLAILTVGLGGCIGEDVIDDEIDPVIGITSTVDTIMVGGTFQFEHSFRNNVGDEEDVEVTWTSSAPEVLTVSPTGLGQALKAGDATVTVSFDDGVNSLSDEIQVSVGEATVIGVDTFSGLIRTTSTYRLEGSFQIYADGDNVVIDIKDDYVASRALPGLYVYLSNNPNTINNAHEIARVTTFSGSHTYIIPDISPTDYSYLLYYCKPFNVKVGDGEIKK